MQSNATTVDQYIAEAPKERQPYLQKLRDVIQKNLPEGIEESMNYGTVGYVVPHSIYPDGYHCTPDLPLPFSGFASQKNYISLYHSPLYADEKLYTWFTEQYSKIAKHKIDMGKCCIRFKYLDEIPFDLIGELMQKMSTQDWIELYEKSIQK